MEILRGKKSLDIDGAGLGSRLVGYSGVLVDVGTGDGRYILHAARRAAAQFSIGVDACREPLRSSSQSAPPNTLFVIANALALPPELDGVANHITINFPWGSLLSGLLVPEPSLMDGLLAMARPGARVEIRLNGGALTEAEWLFEAGAMRVAETLDAYGFRIERSHALDAGQLRLLPSTWAKRLAYGRDPRAVELRALAPPALPHTVRSRTDGNVICCS